MKFVMLIAVLFLVLVVVATTIFVLPMWYDVLAGCPSGSVLTENGECSCPNECCLAESRLEQKDCAADFECIEGSCVEIVPEELECTSVCCVGEENVLEKPCSEGFSCVENDCVADILPCTDDCCLADSGFEEKNCETGLECVDGNCMEIVFEKEPCPFDCCGSHDKNYETKACPAGQFCSYYSHTCRIA